MKKSQIFLIFLVFLVFTICIIGVIFDNTATAEEDDSFDWFNNTYPETEPTPEPTYEELVSPSTKAADEPRVLDYTFDEALKAATNDDVFSLDTFAELIGAELWDTAGTYDAYYIIHRDYINLFAIKFEGNFRLFFVNTYSVTVETTFPYNNLDAARALYYLATVPTPNMTELETATTILPATEETPETTLPLDYLPLDTTYEIIVYADALEFDDASSIIIVEKLYTASVLRRFYLP